MNEEERWDRADDLATKWMTMMEMMRQIDPIKTNWAEFQRMREELGPDELLDTLRQAFARMIQESNP